MVHRLQRANANGFAKEGVERSKRVLGFVNVKVEGQ